MKQKKQQLIQDKKKKDKTRQKQMGLIELKRGVPLFCSFGPPVNKYLSASPDPQILVLQTQWRKLEQKYPVFLD